MDVKPYTFTYSELKSATQDFDPSNKLGEGGFGPVYKVCHIYLEITIYVIPFNMFCFG